MNTTRLVQARRLWSVGHVSRDMQRANMRKWVQSVRFLGDRWKMARPMDSSVLREPAEMLASYGRHQPAKPAFTSTLRGKI
jgi:hypothetical protein